MSEEHQEALLLAKESLAKIQNFDAKSIVRTARLGDAFDFSAAEEAARAIVDLFKQVGSGGLAALPTSTLHQLASMSAQTIQIFQQCLDFDPTAQNASSTRDGVVSQINSHISSVFNVLSPIISYLGSQQSTEQTAVGRLLNELNLAKAEIQSLVREAEAAKSQTAAVLEMARTASGNVGVRNESNYFMNEATMHDAAAGDWKKATIGVALLLLAYSVGTAFLHKWDWFMPTNNIGLTQFIVSKILIFGVLGYLLNLCAKNFLNHKHNAIVNKHRQNSLLTYETMVNAGQTEEARNIVLQLAAASVYQLHDTGYVKSSEGSGRGGIVEILPKTSIPIGSGGAT